MEGQTQVQNQPTPAKITKNQMILLIISTLLVLSISAYYTVLYFQQEKLSKSLIQEFTQVIESKQYEKSHALLDNLESQVLGSHLENTRQQMIQIVEQHVKSLTTKFIHNEIQIEELLQSFESLEKIEYFESILAENKEIAERCLQARTYYAEGIARFVQGDYVGSLEQYVQVTTEDPKNYELTQAAIGQSFNKIYLRTQKLGIQGEYDKATDLLNQVLEYYPNNEEVEEKIAALEQARIEEERNLVLYEGPVQHIFFHPLIAFPELTFDGDAQSRGFNEWFVTVPEFKKIIESLYKKDFILVNISDLYETKVIDEKETIVPKQLRLPKGKKPMVISIDDLNYYRYMIQNGTVHRLIVDEEEKVATYSKTPEGEDLISYDNGIIPILDKFVEEHPDFSFRGAKAVIALTGYEGILGYRTEPELEIFEQEKEEALKVVSALKDNGWTFASHSQGHPNIRDVSYEKVVRDTDRWLREVGSLIGPTEVYIYPFGATVKPDDPKFKYMQSAGFKVFCGVGPNPYLVYSDQYILMNRRHIDGIALFFQGESTRDLYDFEEIIDPVRPQL